MVVVNITNNSNTISHIKLHHHQLIYRPLMTMTKIGDLLKIRSRFSFIKANHYQTRNFVLLGTSYISRYYFRELQNRTDLVKDRFNNYRKFVYSHLNVSLTMKFLNAKTFISVTYKVMVFKSIH